MNWSEDALLSKAKIYFEKANTEDKDSMFFGMYSALGMELLARAAVAHISPALLADPSNYTNLLYALNLKDDDCNPKSIMTNKVIALCGVLVPEFNTDLQKVATLMTERRNEELHTGGGGFAEYNVDDWLADYYKVCQVLGSFLGETLETLFGKDVAKEAEEIIAEVAEKVMKAVRDKISARKKTYEEDKVNNPEEIEKLIISAKANMFAKTHAGFHKVACPCCGNDAVIFGKESDNSHETIEGDEVRVVKEVNANTFQCGVCKLHLSSYAELKAAGLPLHYTNTYYYDPTEFFGIDVDSMVAEGFIEEYSNE